MASFHTAFNPQLDGHARWLSSEQADTSKAPLATTTKPEQTVSDLLNIEPKVVMHGGNPGPQISNELVKAAISPPPTPKSSPQLLSIAVDPKLPFGDPFQGGGFFSQSNPPSTNMLLSEPSQQLTMGQWLAPLPSASYFPSSSQPVSKPQAPSAPAEQVASLSIVLIPVEQSTPVVNHVQFAEKETVIPNAGIEDSQTSSVQNPPTETVPANPTPPKKGWARFCSSIWKCVLGALKALCCCFSSKPKQGRISV